MRVSVWCVCMVGVSSVCVCAPPGGVEYRGVPGEGYEVRCCGDLPRDGGSSP